MLWVCFAQGVGDNSDFAHIDQGKSVGLGLCPLAFCQIYDWWISEENSALFLLQMNRTARCHTNLEDENVHGNQLNSGGFGRIYMDVYAYPPTRLSEVGIA